MNDIQILKEEYSVVVIGGGPAGIAAAISASEFTDNILLLERSEQLGGVLNQCIHEGFGTQIFRQELTGPEYAEIFADKLRGTQVNILTSATVLSIAKNKIDAIGNKQNKNTNNQNSTIEHRKTTIVNFIHPSFGYITIQAKAVIVATGCRERTRAAIGISGTKPSGIFTAGQAQIYLNIEGKQIGDKIVILGSGDIGLCMARRLTIEGSTVLGVYEIMSQTNSLSKNIHKCLDFFSIPLYLCHTITQIFGTKRIESVEISQVDQNQMLIPNTRTIVECDTLILNTGIVPDNEILLSMGAKMISNTRVPILTSNFETTVEGIFACGDLVQIHDLVDKATKEAELVGKNAARYANCQLLTSNFHFSYPNSTIGITESKQSFCDNQLHSAKNTIEDKERFKTDLQYSNKQILTTTVPYQQSHKRVPLKSTDTISKEKFQDVMNLLQGLIITSPIKRGDIVLKNILELNIDLVATKSVN